MNKFIDKIGIKFGITEFKGLYNKRKSNLVIIDIGESNGQSLYYSILMLKSQKFLLSEKKEAKNDIVASFKNDLMRFLEDENMTTRGKTLTRNHISFNIFDDNLCLLISHFYKIKLVIFSVERHEDIISEISDTFDGKFIVSIYNPTSTSTLDETVILVKTQSNFYSPLKFIIKSEQSDFISYIENIYSNIGEVSIINIYD